MLSSLLQIILSWSWIGWHWTGFIFAVIFTEFSYPVIEVPLTLICQSRGMDYWWQFISMRAPVCIPKKIKAFFIRILMLFTENLAWCWAGELKVMIVFYVLYAFKVTLKERFPVMCGDQYTVSICNKLRMVTVGWPFHNICHFFDGAHLCSSEKMLEKAKTPIRRKFGVSYDQKWQCYGLMKTRQNTPC